LLLLLLLLLLSACAPVAPERKRFFWPPGTDRPKIEYINFYQTVDDVKRGTENWLEEAILGKSIPQVLFTRPFTIASDGKGRVFVSDVSQRKVFIFDLERHQVRTLNTSKGAVQHFRFPFGLAVDDQSGRVFVADALSDKIYAFGNDEKLIDSFALEGITRPAGIAFDSSRQRLYVVDADGHRLGVFDANGTPLRLLGERGEAAGQFNFPLDVDLDREGNLYVLDSMNARVQVFDPEGRFLRAFGERGTALGSFQIPKGIAVSPSGHVYVTDSQAHRMVIFDLQGTYLMTVGGQSAVTAGKVSPGGFYLPQGVDVDETDAVWVVDSLNRMFHQFQYLSAEYLEAHPILPGQTYIPPGFDR
jgi:DNA-binding beta-propeller fold protein YncE